MTRINYFVASDKFDCWPLTGGRASLQTVKRSKWPKRRRKFHSLTSCGLRLTVDIETNGNQFCFPLAETQKKHTTTCKYVRRYAMVLIAVVLHWIFLARDAYAGTRKTIKCLTGVSECACAFAVVRGSPRKRKVLNEAEEEEERDEII